MPAVLFCASLCSPVIVEGVPYLHLGSPVKHGHEHRHSIGLNASDMANHLGRPWTEPGSIGPVHRCESAAGLTLREVALNLRLIVSFEAFRQLLDLCFWQRRFSSYRCGEPFGFCRIALDDFFAAVNVLNEVLVRSVRFRDSCNLGDFGSSCT